MSETIRRGIALGLVLLIGIGGLYPVSYTGCPAWSILVVDASGRPMPGITVRRSCMDYSTEKIEHEDNATTDDLGKVLFAKIQLRSALFQRWVGNLMNVAMQGVHASFGLHGWVAAFGQGMQYAG